MKQSFFEETLGAAHSPAFEPVCDGLKSVFEPLACDSMPLDFNRLMEALDDAYSRGDLFDGSTHRT